MTWARPFALGTRHGWIGALGALAGLWACGARDVRPPAEAPPEARTEPIEWAGWASTPSHQVPEGAPGWVVHVGPGVAGRVVPAVVYLHGWDGCAQAVVRTGEAVACYPGGPTRAGWDVQGLVGASGVDAVVAVPQLAFLARSSSAGRFAEGEFARAWWSELAADIEGRASVRPGRIVGVAHSGGYKSLQALMQADLPGLDTAVFLDGLYGGGDEVARWVAGGPERRALSIHTGNRDTAGQSRLLARRAADALGADAVGVDPPDLGAALERHRVVVLQTDVAHGAVPERYLAEVLRALLR